MFRTFEDTSVAGLWIVLAILGASMIISGIVGA